MFLSRLNEISGGCEKILPEMFVLLIVDQFVGRDDGPLEQQKQDSPARLSKKLHISSDFDEK